MTDAHHDDDAAVRARRAVMQALVEAGIVRLDRPGRLWRPGGGPATADSRGLDELAMRLVQAQDDAGAWLGLARGTQDQRQATDLAERALWYGQDDVVDQALQLLETLAPDGLHARVASLVRQARRLSPSTLVAQVSALSRAVELDRHLSRRGRWILTSALARASGSPDEGMLARARDDALDELARHGVRPAEVPQAVRQAIQRTYVFGATGDAGAFLAVAAEAVLQPGPDDPVRAVRAAAFRSLHALHAAMAGNVAPSAVVGREVMEILARHDQAQADRQRPGQHRPWSSVATMDAALARANVAAIMDMEAPGTGEALLVQAIQEVRSVAPEPGRRDESPLASVVSDVMLAVATAMAADPSRGVQDRPVREFVAMASAMAPLAALDFAEKVAKRAPEAARLLSQDQEFGQLLRRLAQQTAPAPTDVARLERWAYYLSAAWDGRLPPEDARVAMAAILLERPQGDMEQVSELTMCYLLAPTFRSFPDPAGAARQALQGPMGQAMPARFFVQAAGLMAAAMEGRDVQADDLAQLLDELLAWREEAPNARVFTDNTTLLTRSIMARLLLDDALIDIVPGMGRDADQVESMLRSVAHAWHEPDESQPSDVDDAVKMLRGVAFAATKVGLQELAREAFGRAVALTRGLVVRAAQRPQPELARTATLCFAALVAGARQTGIAGPVQTLFQEVAQTAGQQVRQAIGARGRDRQAHDADRAASVRWWLRILSRGTQLALQTGMDRLAREALGQVLDAAVQLHQGSHGAWGSHSEALGEVIWHPSDSVLLAMARLRGQERVDAFRRLAPVIRDVTSSMQDFRALEVQSLVAREVVGGRSAWSAAIERWASDDERGIRRRILRDAPAEGRR